MDPADEVVFISKNPRASTVVYAPSIYVETINKRI